MRCRPASVPTSIGRRSWSRIVAVGSRIGRRARRISSATRPRRWSAEACPSWCPQRSGNDIRQGCEQRATGVLEPSGAVMIPVVYSDGQTRSYASHIFPIRDPHGELLAVGAAWSPQHDRDTSLRPFE